MTTSSTTYKQLLATAKELGIKGRHDLDKHMLAAKINTAEYDVFIKQDEAAFDVLLDKASKYDIDNGMFLEELQAAVAAAEAAEAEKQTKSVVEQAVETAALIDADAKPRRKGGGRGSNLNAPWQRKYYYLDLPIYDKARDSIKTGQVKLILRHMAETGVTTASDAEQGGTIVAEMVAQRKITTVIEPQILFAYYRRRMEDYGLVFAGYNLGEEGADEDDVAEANVERMEAEAEADLDQSAEVSELEGEE